MIHTVLMVFLILLKIIGILLLCILGLLLLLLLAVLLVPIRYRVEGVCSGREKRMSVKVTWFLHLLSIAVQFNGAWKIKGKLFGIQMYPRKQKRPGVTKKQDKEEEEPLEETQKAKTAKTGETAEDIDKVSGPETTELKAFEEKVSAEEMQKAQEPSENPKEKTLEDRMIRTISGFFYRTKLRISHIRDLFTGLCDTVRKIKDKAAAVWNFLDEECTKESISFIKKRFFLILKHIKPGKITGHLHFGTGDPAFTGQLLGGLSMVYGFVPDTLKMIPDFEHRILEGDIRLKGHVRIIHLVIAAVRLFFNKNVREAIEKAKFYYNNTK